jgi:hypothetical protein
LTQLVNDLLFSTVAALNVFPLSHTKSTPHGYFKQPFLSFSSFAEKEHPVGAVGQAGNEHCGVVGTTPLPPLLPPFFFIIFITNGFFLCNNDDVPVAFPPFNVARSSNISSIASLFASIIVA